MASPAVPPAIDWTAFEKDFEKWEVVADVIDQQIDIMLNFRQSGHPGGSRSKVHMMTALLLGFMNWDIRAPEKRFADRFVMVSGHVTPLVYGTLAVLGDCMRTMYQRTGDKKYYIDPERIVLPEDLKGFRRRHGLPGHCEMAGKTLFVKSNNIVIWVLLLILCVFGLRVMMMALHAFLARTALMTRLSIRLVIVVLILVL